MKRFLPTILLLFIVFLSANAQKNDFQRRLYFGVGGGPLFSTVDFVPNIFQEMHLGFHGGVSAKYISEKNLGMILELNLAQRGWKEEFPPESTLAYSRTLTYLEVPIFTHIYFGNKARFIINLGPQMSFLLGNKAKPNQDFVANNPTGTQYGNPERRFDYGLTGGLGMELNTALGAFDLEGRYYFGLGDIFDNKREADKQKFSRSAHRVIEGKLTYYFQL